jgi:hypothetical protein
MEHRLIGGIRDRAEAVHAAHVVDAIHGRIPGGRAWATPIIASRVTSVASSASVNRSVPTGRYGSTM